MKRMDKWLQEMRIQKALDRIPAGCRVLDIGCRYGELFQALEGKLAEGVGIDPIHQSPIHTKHFVLLNGTFPDAIPADSKFEIITALAVLEHIPENEQIDFVNACREHLSINGRVILTVPHRMVDPIIHALQKLSIMHGQSVEEHYGFDQGKVIPLFTSHGFRLVEHTRFQLGLNNVFVFEKAS
jgi:2-polyprenyl-3-methyl-5-hydroxy-6-metoxy-1,4-benzoquinol methylase